MIKSQKMTENFLSHEKSMKINNKNKKDPFIELDFVSAKKKKLYLCCVFTLNVSESQRDW